MFNLGIISKISCLKTFQNSVLGGVTACGTANSEIRTFVVVIDGKKITINIATVNYIVVMFVT